jgi:hypothetical protein
MFSSNNGISGIIDGVIQSNRESFARDEMAQSQDTNHVVMMGLIAQRNRIQNELETEQAHMLAVRSAIQASIKRIVGDDENVLLLKDLDLRNRIGKAGEVALELTRNWDKAKEAGATFKLPPEAELIAHLVSRKKFQKIVDLANERTDIANERTDMLNKANVEIAELKASNAKIARELADVTLALGEMAKQAGELRNAPKSAPGQDAAAFKTLQDVNKSLSNHSVELQREVDSLIKNCAQHMAQSSAFRAQLNDVDPTNPLITDSLLRQRVAEVAYSQLAATNFKDWDVVKQVGSSFVSPRERRKDADGGSPVQV